MSSPTPNNPNPKSSRPPTSPLKSEPMVGGKRLFPKSSARKPLSKEQKPVVTIIGGIFVIIFISIVWYYGMVLPAKQATIQAQQEAQKKELEIVKLREEMTRRQQQLKQTEATGLITVGTLPPGAHVTVGEVTQITPAGSPVTFKNIQVGSCEVRLRLTGYEDVSRAVEVKENEITALGTIRLVRSMGKIDFVSPYDGVTYSLSAESGSGPGKTGTVPGLLSDLPTGVYIVTAKRGNSQAVVNVTVPPNETVKVNLDFAYGSVSLTSEPPGARVYEEHRNLGVTPLLLNQLKPGPVSYRLTLRGYKVATVTGQVTENIKVALSAKLEPSRDLISASGIEMVWLPAGYWAGRYEVTQEQYQAVTGYSPSAFSGLQKPVETVSWNEAMDFCKQLNEKERAAGKLPVGYRYTLPSETEWLYYAADAALGDAVTSQEESRNATEDVGSLGPNQLGLHDTRGNIWEWCRNPLDAEGKVYPTRGACWLSSKEEDLKISGRSPAPAHYKDKFVGFRVVLIKN